PAKGPPFEFAISRASISRYRCGLAPARSDTHVRGRGPKSRRAATTSASKSRRIGEAVPGRGIAAQCPVCLGPSTQELERLSAQATLYDPFPLQFRRDAGLEAGMRVLDVGCDKGEVSFLAARLVGPTRSVVGVDRVPAAVEAASQRAREMSVTTISIPCGRRWWHVRGGVVRCRRRPARPRILARPVCDAPEQCCQCPARRCDRLPQIDWSGCRSLPSCRPLGAASNG